MLYVLGFCGVLPAAAWLIGHAFTEKPILAGPFVFMSPILAIGCVLMLCSFVRFIEKNRLFRDTELEDEINAIGAQLGLQPLKVYPQLRDSKPRSSPLDVWSDGIDVYSTIWNAFNKRQRDFLVVHALAKSSGEDSLVKRYIVLLTVLAIVGSVLASLSLWTILISQSVGTLVIILVARASARRQLVYADTRALELMKDFAAARNFVGWHSAFFGKWLGDVAKLRLASLRQEAVRLDIAD